MNTNSRLLVSRLDALPPALHAALSLLPPPLIPALVLPPPQARLEVLDAETEGQLGYILELELNNALAGRDVAALLTQARRGAAFVTQGVGRGGMLAVSCQLPASHLSSSQCCLRVRPTH